MKFITSDTIGMLDIVIIERDDTLFVPFVAVKVFINEVFGFLKIVLRGSNIWNRPPTFNFKSAH